LNRLRKKTSAPGYLTTFIPKYLESIDNPPVTQNNGGTQRLEIDFSQIRSFILDEKAKKEAVTKEEKKAQAEERKVKRLEMKEKFGYAEVDGQRLEVANWTSEPSCLFAGRGDHPQRGRWKEGPSQEDITLNLSPTAPNWKNGTEKSRGNQTRCTLQNGSINSQAKSSTFGLATPLS
jgi:hypothetical protein